MFETLSTAVAYGGWWCCCALTQHVLSNSHNSELRVRTDSVLPLRAMHSNLDDALELRGRSKLLCVHDAPDAATVAEASLYDGNSSVETQQMPRRMPWRMPRWFVRRGWVQAVVTRRRPSCCVWRLGWTTDHEWTMDGRMQRTTDDSAWEAPGDDAICGRAGHEQGRLAQMCCWACCACDRRARLVMRRDGHVASDGDDGIVTTWACGCNQLRGGPFKAGTVQLLFLAMPLLLLCHARLAARRSATPCSQAPARTG